MRGALSALLTAIIASGAVIAAPASLAHATADPPVAAHVVLINRPAISVCTGHKFTVGVWFQRSSGGSRAYRIAVSGPLHRRFFYQAGRAPSSHWRFWHVLAGRSGRYKIVYSSHRPGSRKWTRFVVYTRAHRCNGG